MPQAPERGDAHRDREDGHADDDRTADTVAQYEGNRTDERQHGDDIRGAMNRRHVDGADGERLQQALKESRAERAESRGGGIARHPPVEQRNERRRRESGDGVDGEEPPPVEQKGDGRRESSGGEQRGGAGGCEESEKRQRDREVVGFRGVRLQEQRKHRRGEQDQQRVGTRLAAVINRQGGAGKQQREGD